MTSEKIDILVIVILIIIFIVLVCMVIQQHSTAFQCGCTNYHEHFVNCKNTPPPLRGLFSQLPLFNGIKPVKNVPLGANETMVVYNGPDGFQGSCNNNINGVNKLKKKNRYGTMRTSKVPGNQSYAYCEYGVDNPFDKKNNPN